ncbi:cache domain-containing protein [Amphritea sp.]|uniref:sensor domain-containing diguanylate cyclase n=1 Tax=Amphritea sp. TaxID=1872502 RepID=UPI003D123A7E
MLNSNNSTRLPTQLLWGVFFIILLLLLSQSVYFYFNTQSQHQIQQDTLRENLMQAERGRLKAEMADAEHMINEMFAEAMHQLKQHSRDQTRQALSLMNSLYQRYHQTLSEAEMKQMLVEAIRDVRFFDGRGYYFIKEMNGTSVLLPIAPEREGSSLYAEQDDKGHFITQGLIDAVSNPQKSGFSSYRWFQSDKAKPMEDKISYVEVFEPYNWIVGTGDYLYHFENDLKPRIYNYIRNIRFANSGYVALVRDDGVLLASGATPEREGINYLYDANPQVRDSAQKAVDKARAGGGYQYYNWYKPGATEPSPKLSLIHPLTDKGWILVVGIFQDELNNLLTAQEQIKDSEIHAIALNQVFAFTIIGLLALLVSLTFGRWLKARFKRYEHDINRQQAMLRKTADSLKLSGMIVDSAYEGIIVCDADQRILQVNSAFTRITGYRADEVLGQTPAMLSSSLQDEEFYQRMWQQLNSEGVWRGEIWNQRKNGEVFPEWISISAYKDSGGKVQHYIAIFYDITQRKELEQQLRFMAETDPLTGLANRRTLMDCLNRDLATKERHLMPGIALLFVDLDHFKLINDQLGHDVGDAVLVDVANKLKRCLRETDLACRVGGDEFVIIIKLRPEEGREQLEVLCKRLLEQLIKPVCFADTEIDISCSIGAAIHLQGEDSSELMKSADQALYEAKRQGRGRVVFYCDALKASVSPSPAEAENP